MPRYVLLQNRIVVKPEVSHEKVVHWLCAGLAHNEAIITGYHVVEQVWTCCDFMRYMDRTFRLTWTVSAQHEQQTVFVMELHSGKYPTYITKGGLISEMFSFWLRYLKKKDAKSLFLAVSSKEKMLMIVI